MPNESGIKTATPTGADSTLFRIAGFGASFAFGAMVASLFALKPVPDGLSFELNAGAVVSFIAAALFAWFYWRLIARMATDPSTPRKKKFLIFSAGVVVIGIISFLYPLKFVPASKRADVFIGLALAIGCITGVGIVMWKVKKFLDADLKHTEEEERGNK